MAHGVPALTKSGWSGIANSRDKGNRNTIQLQYITAKSRDKLNTSGKVKGQIGEAGAIDLLPERLICFPPSKLLVGTSVRSLFAEWTNC